MGILEDALMDRDLVHRQTACTTVMHMALGVIGLGNEDAMQHLMNLIWPNLFETSPHQGPAVHAAGPLPPGAQGARRLLEGLQQPLHWLAGRPRARLPTYRRRRTQPVPADAPRALPMRRRGRAADFFWPR